MGSDTEKELWEQMQEEILEDARKHYSEKAIDRWLNPRNVGKVEDPQGFRRKTGICGDTMEISLRIINDKIIEARFLTDGCGPTLAAGSMATELAAGKSVQEALEIRQQVILNNLGGLPEESEHCALLASDTLKEALKDYFAYKKEPWKRAYKTKTY
jgi:nitrogen fixation NifU-like protein